MDTIDYSSFLENKVFLRRYLQANVNWKFSNLKGERGFMRIFKLPFALIAKKYFLHNYFKNRVKNGFVDIPYLELVLTTKCNMRCESCNNLMQYFSSSNYYMTTLDGIKESLEILLKRVDSIQRLRIIGGEPLLFKELPELITYLDSCEKIVGFDIVTNATIDFSETLLERIKKAKRLKKVSISDYSKSPNLKIPFKGREITQKLKSIGVRYAINTGDSWYDVGKIYKRNRTQEELQKNFRSCGMECVSLISAIKENSKIPKGAIFVCPVGSSLSQLRGTDEFQGDFIDLSKSSSKDFFEFYVKDFFLACDYCQDWSLPKKSIPIAIQTKKVLGIDNNVLEESN